ncbi:hypothetical protein NQZ68_007941 [Dissostichus eleginoides]|nr:hypothetical protein NQZ68_007941 [Dissostichus eleginoides]
MANTPEGPYVESMKGLLDGHGEHTARREWKCSVMVEHGRLVVIRDHLFLSEHKASAAEIKTERKVASGAVDPPPPFCPPQGDRMFSAVISKQSWRPADRLAPERPGHTDNARPSVMSEEEGCGMDLLSCLGMRQSACTQESRVTFLPSDYWGLWRSIRNMCGGLEAADGKSSVSVRQLTLISPKKPEPKQSQQRNAAETRKCLPAPSFSYRAESVPLENGPEREWKNPRHLAERQDGTPLSAHSQRNVVVYFPETQPPVAAAGHSAQNCPARVPWQYKVPALEQIIRAQERKLSGLLATLGGRRWRTEQLTEEQEEGQRDSRAQELLPPTEGPLHRTEPATHFAAAAAAESPAETRLSGSLAS